MRKVTIINSSKELTARERIAFKDVTNAIKLDIATLDGAFEITPTGYITLGVETDEKEYEQYVILDNAGNKFTTGSKSFMSAFLDIFNELKDEGDEYTITIYRVPSKNYKGKDFITCSLVI